MKWEASYGGRRGGCTFLDVQPRRAVAEHPVAVVVAVGADGLHAQHALRQQYALVELELKELGLALLALRFRHLGAPVTFITYVQQQQVG